MRDERKAQQEIERERSKLAKERQHYQNALGVVTANGDEAGVKRLQEQIVGKRDFLPTVTPALLTDGLRIEGGI